MADTATILILLLAATAGLSIASAAALRGWNGWLAVKRLELSAPARGETAAPSPTARTELAHLKERVRRLEAIASGVDY